MMLSEFKKVIKGLTYDKLTFQATNELEFELKKIYPLVKIECKGTSMTIKVVKKTKYKTYEEDMFDIRIYRKRTPDRNYIITDFDLNFANEKYMNINRIYKAIVNRLNKLDTLRQQKALETLNKIKELNIQVQDFETLSNDYLELKDEIGDLIATD